METLPEALQPRILDTRRGRIFVFHGKWRPEYRHFLQEKGVVGVAASFCKNDFETDFSFLSEFPHLQYFASGATSAIRLESLYCLRDLRYIRFLYTHGLTFDFTRFANIEAVEMSWTQGMASIFQCASLKR